MTQQLVYTCSPGEVFVPPNRIRKEFDERYLDSLAESIKQNKQIQPGVCIKEPDGSVTLVAGECRLKACKIAGVDYQYTLRDETDPRILRRIELEENVRRNDLSLREELLAKKELLESFQEEEGLPKTGRGGGGFGEKKYSEYLGESIGKTHEDLEIALFMHEIPEVAEAKTRADAKKIIKRIKEDYTRHITLEKAHEELKTSAAASAAIHGEGIYIGKTGDSREETLPRKEGEETGLSTMALAVAAASSRTHSGRMEELLLEYPDEHFNLIFFDPPWRVNFDAVRKPSGGTQTYADGELTPQAFKEELTNWLQLLYQKMNPNSHLYLFFGIRNETIQEDEEEADLALGLVYGSLESVGFKTNRIPIIWWKQGARVTRNPTIWPGRSYEPIAYARKGSKDLVLRGASDVIPTPAPTPTMKQTHPSAKHPQIYLELLKRSAAPGDKVLDPMCGSGMMGVAADTLRATHALDWQMFEIEENFYNLTIMNLVKGFSRVVGATMEPKRTASGGTPVEYGDPARKDFSDLVPGTAEFFDHWTNFNKDRYNMMEFWRIEGESLVQTMKIWEDKGWIPLPKGKEGEA